MRPRNDNYYPPKHRQPTAPKDNFSGTNAAKNRNLSTNK